jgi:AsmA protein
MRKAARRIVIGLGAIVGLLVLVVICVSLFFDVNRYKPQIEAAAAKSTGMDLKINGKINLKFLPTTRIVLNDIHLRNQGSEILTARQIVATPSLIAYLLHREIEIGKISIDHPHVKIEKSASGKMNYETSRSSQAGKKEKAGQKSEAPSKTGNIHSIRVVGAELNYVDHSTQKRIQANGLNAHVSGIHWNTPNQGDPSAKPNLVRSISFQGTLDADSALVGKTRAKDLKAEIRVDKGLIRLESTDVKVFSGTIQGTAQADLRGKTPKWAIDQKASALDLSQLSDKAKGKISGLANATAKLTASGSDSPAITKSLDGLVTVQSENIQLQSKKLEMLSSLLGAIPDLSSLFSERTDIQKLFMNWTVHHGIAHATDVAVSTAKGKVAARGDINLANKTFQNFFIAPIDDHGCSKKQIELAGSIASPHPEVASMGEQIARSKLKEFLGQQGAQLGGQAGDVQGRGGSGCDHFYTGHLVGSAGK